MKAAFRRRFAFGLGALALLLGCAVIIVPRLARQSLNSVLHEPPYVVGPEATALHDSLVVVDLHADALLWNGDLTARSSIGHVDIPRLIEGNVAVQGFTVVTKTPRNMNIDHNSAASDQITLLAIAQRWPQRTWRSLMERALYQATRLTELAARSDGKLWLIRDRQELDEYLERRAADPAITAGFLGLEGTHALEGRLENVNQLFASGFRMIGLTHFFDNAVGGSAHGVQRGGLTDLGRQVVLRSQHLGMLIDLAHASSALIDDVLELAEAPVVVSHTGVRGTCDNQRNLSDAQLRAIAANGGVVGIGFWPTAVCGEDAAAIARAVRYTVDLVGPEHVALGSDFDGAVAVPFDASGMALVTEALLQAGLDPPEILMIMGGNVVGLLRRVLP